MEKQPWLVVVLMRLGVPAALAVAIVTAIALLVGGCAATLDGPDLRKQSGSSSTTQADSGPVLPKQPVAQE